MLEYVPALSVIKSVGFEWDVIDSCKTENQNQFSFKWDLQLYLLFCLIKKLNETPWDIFNEIE